MTQTSLIVVSCVLSPSRTHRSSAQVEAERRLLQAALRDPLNQRFVLLSEACLPMYPPHLLWAQLMAEQKARVNACAAPTAEDAERRFVARCALCRTLIQRHFWHAGGSAACKLRHGVLHNLQYTSRWHGRCHVDVGPDARLAGGSPAESPLPFWEVAWHAHSAL